MATATTVVTCSFGRACVNLVVTRGRTARAGPLRGRQNLVACGRDVRCNSSAGEDNASTRVTGRRLFLAAAAAATISAPLLIAPTAEAFDVEGRIDDDDGAPSTSTSSSAVSASPLECASDPACVNERNALMAGGAYVPPTEYVEEDPDGALRRSICPRNPTADICRSLKDRKKVNDSKCLIPIGLGCAMWKK